MRLSWEVIAFFIFVYVIFFHNLFVMSSFYIVILLVGSFTLSKKINELIKSVRAGDKGKIKVDILFLFLTVLLIALLIVFKKFLKS